MGFVVRMQKQGRGKLLFASVQNSRVTCRQISSECFFCGRLDYQYISIYYSKLHFAETRVSKTLEEMKNATVVAGVAVCASVCACASARVFVFPEFMCKAEQVKTA